MPGTIGISGLVIIALVLLLVFGPKRIPEIARSLGSGMREFKDSVTGDDDHRERPAVTAEPVAPATRVEAKPVEREHAPQ